MTKKDLETDPLYEESLKFILETRHTSALSLHGYFSIDFTRAFQLISLMEKNGIVSPMDRTGQRSLLIPEEELPPSKRDLLSRGPIIWATIIFGDITKEFEEIDWRKLYNTYKGNFYSPRKVRKRFQSLYTDPFIKDKHGIFEFILSNEEYLPLLNVEVFDEAMKNDLYLTQTTEATTKGISNCPICTIGKGVRTTRIWPKKDMEIDHVTAWLRNEVTNLSAARLLCSRHNRTVGNAKGSVQLFTYN